MAGDWIKMRTNLWDDPRIAKLCDATDQPEAMVVGALYWLWSAADQHSEDGLMYGLTIRSLDRKTGIQGFGDALVSIGWIESGEDGIVISRFCEHNGASAKKRVLTAKRVAAFKLGNTNTPEDHPVGNATSVTSTLPVRDLEKDIEKSSKPKPLEPSALVVSELTPCPHSEIVSLYAEILPELPQVRKWEGARIRHLKARWAWVLADLKSKGKPFDKTAGVDFFRRMFGYIRKSDFLMGRSGTFSCSLPWIVTDENFSKIIEGNYENRETPT